MDMQASRIKARWPVAQQQVRNFLERSHVEGWNGPQSRRRQPRQLSSPSSLPFLSLNRTKKTALYVRHCYSIKNRDTNCIRWKSKQKRRILPKWDQETASQLVSASHPRGILWPRRSFVATFCELAFPSPLTPKGKRRRDNEFDSHFLADRIPLFDESLVGEGRFSTPLR